MVHQNFSCAAVEHLFPHQADQSRLDLIIVSSTRRGVDGGASGREVPQEVPLSDGSAFVAQLTVQQVQLLLAEQLVVH